MTYRLKDLNGEPELLRAQQEIFQIDRVIRRDYKKRQALVKWKGYSDEFNSWVLFRERTAINCKIGDLRLYEVFIAKMQPKMARPEGIHMPIKFHTKE